MAIKVLDSQTVAKIAAGEVIERPASVVKELVENSLDAGASQVSVEVAGGGLRLIRVRDDGSGIGAEEAELAFQRYATSKISSSADLGGIATLGFRGEALPSIAAVAEVTMVTRTRRELVGTYVQLRGGKVVKRGLEGCPVGTVVTVRDLFYNLPPRRKFLRSPATENGHVTQVATHYALAFPLVKFHLVGDGKRGFASAGGGLKEAIAAVNGHEVAKHVLEIKVDGTQSPFPPYLQVWGYVSPPSLTRANRSYMSFFVNGRWVQSRTLAYAVEEAYRGVLMGGKYPIAVIHIALPPGDLDVNIHPAKREVRFLREREVFAAVQRAVRQTILEQAPIPPLKGFLDTGVIAVPPRYPLSLAANQEVGRSIPSGEPSAKAGENELATDGDRLPILRILGQIGSTYIIAEGPNGMYMVDQHAAHERVVFERIKAQQVRREIEVQSLLEPLLLDVTARQESLLQEQGDVLRQYGLTIEPFGERTFTVRAVPAGLKERDITNTLREILDSFDSHGDPSRWQEGIAASLACHSAVRAGDTLSQEEMRSLIRQLEETESPRTCPHGRPTMIHLSTFQLQHEFGRR